MFDPGGLSGGGLDEVERRDVLERLADLVEAVVGVRIEEVDKEGVSAQSIPVLQVGQLLAGPLDVGGEPGNSPIPSRSDRPSSVRRSTTSEKLSSPRLWAFSRS